MAEIPVDLVSDSEELQKINKQEQTEKSEIIPEDKNSDESVLDSSLDN